MKAIAKVRQILSRQEKSYLEITRILRAVDQFERSSLREYISHYNPELLDAPPAGHREEVKIGDATFYLRYIPNGKFLMGSSNNDREAFGDEKPQHGVTITRGFWMMETPVTQGQYEAIVGSNPSHFKQAGLNAPVEQVRWLDSALFANKLSALEGAPKSFVRSGKEMRGVGDEAGDYVGSGGWRLPTEAEWEYACRAGSQESRYGELAAIAWYEKNSGKTTHPVGEKVANAWELKDMLGNVYEWCYDWHDWFRTHPTQAATNPVGAATGMFHTLRGGCWYNSAPLVRSSNRFRFSPASRGSGLGFRLVKNFQISESNL